MRYVLLPLILFSQLLLAQETNDSFERGSYAIKNYDHKEYQAHYQNWSITQDKNGFMYIGNGEGILEFDGDSWRLITAPGLNAVRTIYVDEHNIKWVGADRDLGYLKPDSFGTLQYVSLKDKIPSSNPISANIWQIFKEGDRVLFAADNELYSWKNEQFTIIPHPGSGLIYREYQIQGKVYLNIADEGMFQVIGDSLHLIPGGSLFKKVRATVAVPYKQNSVLFVSKNDGLYIYDGSSITKLENEIEGYLNENLLYAGKRLPNDTYAFATLRGGVIIMDSKGKYISKITENEGLANNQVHGMTLDNQNALWLAHQTGVSKVELFSYTFFDKRNGLEGTVTSILRHKGVLYVATYSGLFVLNRSKGNEPSKFRKIEQIKSGCFSLLQTENEIFAATANGVFRITGQEITHLNTLSGCRALGQSKVDKDLIFVGHQHGLSIMQYSDGIWKTKGDINSIKEDIKSIINDKKGNLWLGTSLNTVIKIEISNLKNTDQNSVIEGLKVYRYFKGLPEGPTNVWMIDDDLLVTSEGQGGPLFKLDTVSNTFFSENTYGRKFGLDSLVIYPKAYQNNGQYIFLESNPIYGKSYRYSAFAKENGKYSVQRIYDEPIRSTTETQIYWENQNQIWLGGEGISKFDLRLETSYLSSYRTHIRKMILGQDSIIYGGDPSYPVSPLLSFSPMVFRFEYAAPSFTKPEANLYQYRLVGFDEAWSNWTQETKKDYTNLQEGKYQFLARAQDVYGVIGSIGSITFEILPPWYRTWWAYLLYIILFVIFLWMLLKLRSNQLKSKNQALEKMIAIRTSEVLHQANQLKIQAEKLQELDKSKSRFFANISHEFRTPLTLIKGPIEQLEHNFNEKLNIETVKMIRRNANRLLNMVNQLLDLSKIDEGSLKLSPTEGDVYKCLRAAASSFNSHAAQRNIDYRVQIPTALLWASFDRDKLENVIYNLLGNAFKFSDDGSKISFTSVYTEYILKIEVSDAGKGIPEENLPFIFDRFYQVDTSGNRAKNGSGIGLSLSKDLVELMGGTITVWSEAIKGTYFTVNLPLQEIKTRQKNTVQNEIQKQEFLTKKTFIISKTDKRDLPTILLVEDNSDMRHFITEQLVKFYKINTSINGEEGFQKALYHSPDLVITDLMMPKMDGIELCKKLKTDVLTSHIPVIMLTAKAGIENKIEGLEIGADDYLIKPFEAQELLVRIKNLIEQRQKLRALFSNKDVDVNPKKITVTSIDQKFLEQVLTLMEKNYSDSNFNVPEMQDALAMSKTQLHRKLKALTNEAPGELLRNFRLKRAAQLLSQKADSVTQIAYKVGFNNLSYFAKCFKELYGVAPSSY